MSWLGIGIGMGSNPAVYSGGPPPPTTAIWNGSSDSPASSTAWTRSPDHLTATQTANDDTIAELFASQAKAAGTAIITIPTLGTGSSFLFGGSWSALPLVIGLDDGTETSFIGAHNGVGYRNDGTLLLGGADYRTGGATLTSGKTLTIEKTATYVKWSVNGVLQFTFNGTDYTTSAIVGAMRPAVASMGSHDSQVIIDASGW